MIFKIILLFASLFAIYWTFKIKKIIPGIISLGMVTGIIVSFLKKNFFTGNYIYLGFVAIAFIYGFAEKNKKMYARIIICLMSASKLLYWIWVQNHWHGNTLVLPITTLLAGLAAIISRANFKNEKGFIAILLADAIAILLENWLKAFL